jgi:ribosomal protein S6--L-glutamate ligase
MSTAGLTVGVARNPYERNVVPALLTAAQAAGLPVRVIDIATAHVRVDARGVGRPYDRYGEVAVDCVTPFLLFGFPAAVHAFTVITRGAHSQNPVEAVLAADDKAATTLRLAAAGVAQVPTEIVPFDLTAVREAAVRLGFPAVVKRTHGAQGRWVRRADGADELDQVLAELQVEGPGALLVQPEVVESRGRSIRVVVTGGAPIAVTERHARDGEWRSNINQGGWQHPITLTAEETDLALRAVAALGLAHAGVDILRTAAGPRILEVNACPDFTSMQPFTTDDLAAAVLHASLPTVRPASAPVASRLPR